MMDNNNIVSITLPEPDSDTGTFTSSVEFFIDKMREYRKDRVWVMIESADDLRCEDQIAQLRVAIDPTSPQDFNTHKGILCVIVLRWFTENDSAWISYQSSWVTISRV